MCCENTPRTIVELKEEIKRALRTGMEAMCKNAITNFAKRVQSCHDVIGKHFMQLMSSGNEAAHQTTSVILRVKNVVSFLYHKKVSSWIQFSSRFLRCLHHSLSVALRSLQKHVTFLSCVLFLLPVFRFVFPYNVKNRIGLSYIC